MNAQLETSGSQPFALDLHDLDVKCRVLSFSGHEEMNALYAFDVTISTDQADVLARKLLHANATLFMQPEGSATRRAHGIVGWLEIQGPAGDDQTLIKLQLLPRMSRLMRRRTTRIFQDQTTRDIVSSVLAGCGVPCDWKLRRTLPSRAYCVQYDETDFAFVTRLCAAEGIFFWFDHPKETLGRPQELLVFGDSIHAYPPIQGGATLRFCAAEEGATALIADDGQFRSFQLRQEVGIERVLFRRFDFEKPPNPRREAATTATALAVHNTQAEMKAFAGEMHTIYQHDLSREQALLDPVPADIALEAENALTSVAEATSGCRRLAPGHRFSLIDHEVSFLDGEYVVVSCTHEGRAHGLANATVYSNRIRAVPGTVPVRPPRPNRLLRQGLETAVVVGPRDQEIHTDEYGRVKVQFHWDLDGDSTDSASCWLRVAQPWAGAGYGAQFLPRVGSEVLIGYVGGDTDRPVVVGSLHNGVNITPFSFPDDFEKSGIKTRSSPGGAGGHELVFQDRAGAEFVSLHSTKTLRLSGAENSSLSAEADLTISAGGNRNDEVLGDAATEISGDQTRSVSGRRTTTIGGDDRSEVTGHSDLTIGGHYVVKVDGPVFQVLRGSRSTVVGIDSPADETLGVTGQFRVASAQEMRLSSPTSIQLSCGESRITLHPDHILIESPSIHLQAQKRIALVQGDPAEASLTLEGAASLAGGTASVVGGGKGGGKLFLDADAHLDGALVKLNCGPMGGGGANPVHENTKKATVTFTVAPDGLPPDAQTVTLLVATPTGETIERVCAVGGSISLEGNEGDVFTVVETRIGDKRIALEKKPQQQGQG
jgi:type VI secretion system secreted protein VgrG